MPLRVIRLTEALVARFDAAHRAERLYRNGDDGYLLIASANAELGTELLRVVEAEQDATRLTRLPARAKAVRVGDCPVRRKHEAG